MLSEGFFDILTHASGWVAGKSRRALARHNPLCGKSLLPSPPTAVGWTRTAEARVLASCSCQAQSFADRMRPLLPRSIERGPVEAQ